MTAITFILNHLFPGGANSAARIILGPRATQPQINLFLVQNGLNKPIWTQFGILVGHVFTFNLGYSYKLNEPVSTIVLQKLPKPVLLVGLAILLTLIVAIPLGIFQVLRRNKPSDYALTTLSFIFYATPTFFLGIVLIEVFAIHWHIFPPEAPQSASVGQILADWRALVLPVVALAAVSIAGFSRYMRSSMMEALTADYVRTARAKGLAEAFVIFKHCMRNALIPVVTMMGLQFGFLLGGSIVVEKVFNWPGMGRLLVDAVEMRDYPIIQAEVLLFSLEFILINLIVDVLYGLINPTIRYK